MSQYHGDEMDYVADDNEMAEVEDDMYFSGRVFGDSESDDDDDEYDPSVCFQSYANPLLLFEYPLMWECLFILFAKLFFTINFIFIIMFILLLLVCMSPHYWYD